MVEHILSIFHGDGANGKGTFISAVLAALGDYADAIDPEPLHARTFDADPAGTADLFGLGVVQPVAADVLPLHLEQDRRGVLLALSGPVPDSFHEFFEILRCHAPL